MQGVLKVPNHNLLLLGSGPSTNCTNVHRSSLWRRSVSEREADGVFIAERINSKRADAARRQGVFKVGMEQMWNRVWTGRASILPAPVGVGSTPLLLRNIRNNGGGRDVRLGWKGSISGTRVDGAERK